MIRLKLEIIKYLKVVPYILGKILERKTKMATTGSYFLKICFHLHWSGCTQIFLLVQ